MFSNNTKWNKRKPNGTEGVSTEANSIIPNGTEPVNSEPDIMLFTTKTCPNCPNAKRQLNNAGIIYKIVDAEEQTALTEKYGIKSVPTLVVNGQCINGVGPIVGWIKNQKAQNA